jgi:hypothetical protein
MELKTIHLNEKIAFIEQTIKQEQLEVFAQELVIEDASEKTGDEVLDKQLEDAASVAKKVIVVRNRKIAVRQPVLDKLKAELKELEKSKEKSKET